VVFKTSPVAVAGKSPPYLWGGIGSMGSRSPGFLLRDRRVVLLIGGQEEELSKQSMPDVEYIEMARVEKGINSVSRA